MQLISDTKDDEKNDSGFTMNNFSYSIKIIVLIVLINVVAYILNLW